MFSNHKNSITVITSLQTSLEDAWNIWTLPEHIIKWNFASEEWHCPNATNPIHNGGKFSWRMEAKDKSMGFDFSGTYVHVKPLDQLRLQLDDNREVSITFTQKDDYVEVKEVFEPETQNSIELQKQGWQAILNQYKKYAESISKVLDEA